LECGSWGTLSAETIDAKDEKKEAAKKLGGAAIISLASLDNRPLLRQKTNISEIDRVLGGGIVPGSLILLSGEPGIGKSTLVAQIASRAGVNSEIIYASGEESAVQVRNRMERLAVDFKKIKFISETNVEKIIAAVTQAKPAILIIDSVQTVYSSFIPAEAGGVSQIRAVTVKFLELAKENDIAVILIGHITKDGQVAGPKSLEHIVDTVLYLENEPGNNYCFLRATKNRFGSVNELGVLEMTSHGFDEVKNPGAVFIETSNVEISGSALTCVMEGTRPFLADVQALVSKTVFGYPQRKASGFDLNRLAVLSAVLTKRTKINLTAQDIILNLAGGLKLSDPALDLAVCAAIISSYLNKNFPRDILVLGEIGLGGEVRSVAKLEQRLKEAERLGFKKAIIPTGEAKAGKMELIKIKNLAELAEIIK
jgi:DNA repair protein RadA/Sms